jgi:RHS repeat-associated protein
MLDGGNIDQYFMRSTSSATSTFLTDALGSTVGLVTSNNGPIATSYTYQPFGSVTLNGAGNDNSYEFTGREDDRNGLYSYRARYYSPFGARFVSQDPIEFRGGGLDTYSYV